MRSFLAFVLVLVAMLAAFVAVPANWANRYVVDGDRFTSLMAPIADERGVQDAMADEISGQIQRLLTEQGDSRPPMQTITPYVTAYTHSSQFPPAFADSVREVHRWLFTTPTAQQRLGGATTTQIDLAPMIRQIAAENNVRVGVPEQVTVDLSGTGANRNLFRAGRFAPVAADVGLVSWASIVVGIAAAVLALVCARRRGFTLMFLGLGAALAAGVTWILCIAAPSYVAAGRAGSLSPTVLDAAVGRVTSSITPWVTTEAVIGGAVALIGLLFGGLGSLAARRSRREGW
ncbi:hypothetical protein P0W64_03800 [Tsukamurella sp. 8F]|uniref:hypothetical protein n=1 Tax=unclassified Tsukamurella TaxID=2633480 RepID=UPI0023B8986E|nr:MULTISPECIES: hypothetical protein [unclassified Tsukamurella]MDF0532560.1 hypothetical protein [Tsukamurella sp. 8J]MDF0585897.1 hypothetical protein [Tsukamurella sp. 8F]